MFVHFIIEISQHIRIILIHRLIAIGKDDLCVLRILDRVFQDLLFQVIGIFGVDERVVVSGGEIITPVRIHYRWVRQVGDVHVPVALDDGNDLVR